MTEQEFLEKRIPIWLEGDDLHISRPTSASDRTDMHAFLFYHYLMEMLFQDFLLTTKKAF